MPWAVAASCPGLVWDREIEGGSSSEFGFNPYPATGPLNNAVANCQADTSAGILCGRMKAFENSKDVLLVLRIDADAVVTNGKLPFGPRRLGRDVNYRRFLIAIPKRITEEVLKQLL